MKKRAKRSANHSKLSVWKKLYQTVTLQNTPPKQKRTVMLAGVLTLILGLTSVFAVAFSNSTDPSNSDSPEQASVEEIDTADQQTALLTLRQGTVEVREETEWADATDGMELRAGMDIRTIGASSRGALTLQDGSVVRIDVNSHIMLETLTESRVVIIQESGHIYNRIISADERTYVVQTDNAQFQSVGTAFRTSASGDEESVEVFQNSVRETTGNRKAEEGEKLTAVSYVDPSKDGSIDKIDIEVLKKDAFITWNRELDRQSDEFKDKLGFLSDFDGPNISVTDPVDGSTVDVATTDSQGSVVIKGTVDKGSTLTVQSKSLPGSSAIDVAVDDSGNFTTSTLQALLGTSIFELTATDPVGNVTTLNVSYSFRKETVVQQQGIALLIDESDPDELLIEWGLVGITTPDGVKVVYDTDSTPTYPADDSISKSSGTSTTLKTNKLNSGDTYYFRVCRYDDDNNECDIYSNEVSVDIP